MSAFEPFLKPGASNPGTTSANAFRLTVLPSPANARPFLPLAAPASEPPPANGTCQPQVSLHREGDRVTHIEVQCGCGQRLELACVYES